MKNYRQLFISILAILALFYSFNNFRIETYAHSDRDECGVSTYYIDRDSNNGKVSVDFENNNKQVDIYGVNGYQVVKVEMDVEDDNHSGFWKYSDGNLNNFNPNPGGNIKEVRVTVSKVCFTPTPKVTIRPTIKPTNPGCDNETPSPTPVITATPTSTVTPYSTSTPTSTPYDPCEGECSPTPTSTPQPTILDICQNIDGIQTSIPDGKHLDSTNLNCVEFSPSNSQETKSESSQSSNEIKPQVLGVSTMAKTGSFEESLYYSIFSLGSLLTSVGIMKNGKNKKK